MEEIKSIDVAIEWLTQQGLVASMRNWSFGRSICVGIHKANVNDVRVLKQLVCIHQIEQQWAITDISGTPAGAHADPIVLGSLHAATVHAGSMLHERKKHDANLEFGG